MAAVLGVSSINDFKHTLHAFFLSFLIICKKVDKEKPVDRDTVIA
jgi:hypothetical protein